MPNHFELLTRSDKTLLLQLARLSIGELWQPELHSQITQIRSTLQPVDTLTPCFVTLHLHGQLRGCIGTLHATWKLLDAVCHYAKAAAEQDPRFTPLSFVEWPLIKLSITLLGPLHAIAANNREQLLAQLTPGKDGLYIKDQRHSATFLPMVWQQLTTPEKFVDALLEKGGWQADIWPEHLQAWTYPGEEFAEGKIR